ncbi:MAG: glutamyl-tRNA(Gln) amidotransferase subunit A [Trebouxia sp. A1-2]|nr:MAG: glutamyl-tRNA(Gln) amidotransferase subunit A [Trebouxia sp. A1-2]
MLLLRAVRLRTVSFSVKGARPHVIRSHLLRTVHLCAFSSLTRSLAAESQCHAMRPCLSTQCCRVCFHAAGGMSTKAVDNSSDGFIDPDLSIEHFGEGSLNGLTFAAKDLFDVEGHVTGYGQPTWRATHGAAIKTSPAVQALLGAGADLLGKTHLDELAYSLNGENTHYGTPINPACPDRIPGGSSSGSAVATADGSVDIGLGSDTGGSIRVPASYCGLLGIRPTHGRVSLENACALARSYDTCGWFARNAQVLRKVGEVLLEPSAKQDAPLTRWLTAADAFDHSDKATTGPRAPSGDDRAVRGAPRGDRGQSGGYGITIRLVAGLQNHTEIWQELGAWITANKPQFGPGTKERFEMASKLTPEEIQTAQEKRKQISAHLQELLGKDGVLMLPTAPGPAPILNTPPAELDLFRSRLLSLTCIAGLGGLPQVSLPVVKVEGCPVGLSLMGPRGSDEKLLQLTEKLMALFMQ